MNPFDLFNKEGLYINRQLVELKKLEADLQVLAKKQWQAYDQVQSETRYVQRMIDELEN